MVAVGLLGCHRLRARAGLFGGASRLATLVAFVPALRVAAAAATVAFAAALALAMITLTMMTFTLRLAFAFGAVLGTALARFGRRRQFAHPGDGLAGQPFDRADRLLVDRSDDGDGGATQAGAAGAADA